jgi:hypothetical protein
VALFRRSTEDPEPTSARPSRSAGSSPLKVGGTAKAASPRSKAAAPTPAAPPAAPAAPGAPNVGKKDRPTPSRREAEAARRQRVNRTLTPKEARRLSGQQNREQRMRAVNARESVPEKALMRDYVDARFSIGEFLLPSLVVILAISFLTAVYPRVSAITTVAMYLFILAVLFDSYLLWRGFKRVLAERLPGTPTRGLMMYGVNRAIQIRRFRMPAPRVKRGGTY